jgi:hypothetical protein
MYEDGGRNMIVQKVRGKNELKPIRVTKSEYDLAMRLGLSIEDFVKEYVKRVAKQRRWKWWFEKQEKSNGH